MTICRSPGMANRTARSTMLTGRDDHGQSVRAATRAATQWEKYALTPRLPPPQAGQYVEYLGNSTISFNYTGPKATFLPVDSGAMDVRGSDGSTFSSLLDEDSELWVFEPDAMRSIPLAYKEVRPRGGDTPAPSRLINRHCPRLAAPQHPRPSRHALRGASRRVRPRRYQPHQPGHHPRTHATRGPACSPALTPSLRRSTANRRRSLRPAFSLTAWTIPGPRWRIAPTVTKCWTGPWSRLWTWSRSPGSRSAASSASK